MNKKGMKKIGKAALYLTIISLVSFAIAVTLFFAPGGVYAQGGNENRINVDEAKTRSAEGIEEISIETSSIDVVVVPTSESTVRSELKGYVAGISKDRLPVLTAEKSGDRLVVRGDMNSGVGIGYFEVRLTLTVQVPDSYSGELRIDTSSGEAAVEGFALDLLNIETSSGDFTGDNLSVGILRRNSTSGDTDLEGLTGAYEGKASSGRTDIVFDALVRDIKIDSTSGDVRLKIPAGSGFEPDIETTSGDIDSDFPVTMTVGGKLNDNRLKGSVGSGGATVRIGASSGDVELIEIP